MVAASSTYAYSCRPAQPVLLLALPLAQAVRSRTRRCGLAASRLGDLARLLEHRAHTSAYYNYTVLAHFTLHHIICG